MFFQVNSGGSPSAQEQTSSWCMIGAVEEPLLSPSYFQLSLLMRNICCYEDNDATDGWRCVQGNADPGVEKKKTTLLIPQRGN